MAQPPDHYATLNVAPDAASEVIKAAYKALMLKHHPDQNPQDQSASAKVIGINDAYGVLSNSAARAAYDSRLKYERGSHRFETNPDLTWPPGKEGGASSAAPGASSGGNQKPFSYRWYFGWAAGFVAVFLFFVGVAFLNQTYPVQNLKSLSQVATGTTHLGAVTGASPQPVRSANLDDPRRPQRHNRSAKAQEIGGTDDAGPIVPVKSTPVQIEKVPTNDELAELYPDRALRLEKSGSATIRCTVSAQGLPSDCLIVTEEPEGYGFGDAGVRALHKFVLKAATSNGRPTDGATFKTTINFTLAE
jgi:TonB family protein